MSYIKTEALNKMNELKQFAFELNQLNKNVLEKKNQLADYLRQFQSDYLTNNEINDGSIESFDLQNNWKILAQLC